jgi:hypothetical protein
VRAISRAHLLACAVSPDRHPTVTRTLRTIELREKTRGQRAALFSDDTAMAGSKGPSSSEPPARSARLARRVRGLRQAPRLVSRRP